MAECIIVLTLTEGLHSVLSGLRLPILGITPGIGFLDHPARLPIRVSPCSGYSTILEGTQVGLLRSGCIWVVCLGSDCPPGFGGIKPPLGEWKGSQAVNVGCQSRDSSQTKAWRPFQPDFTGFL